MIEIMVCSLYSSANKLCNYVTVTGFVQGLEICPAIFQTWRKLGMSKFTRSSKNCEKLEKSQNLLKLVNSSGKGDRRLPAKTAISPKIAKIGESAEFAKITKFKC